MVNSDKPGQHDFNVLKKLVLPDGSVLRARYPIKVLQCEVFTVSPIKVGPAHHSFYLKPTKTDELKLFVIYTGL